jgi:hypothetical protein
MVSQASKVYSTSSSYKGENARCLYKLSQIEEALGDRRAAESNRRAAHEIYKGLVTRNSSGKWPDEEGFDQLVVFWSR